MFYSQTYLARKGPLGTVWCAAHLQHRLKKSHYTSTDISSTVDRIMFPEVPIALRMSGHLLLGVVRIYSKKVDYLYHDCNVVLVGLKKTFAPTHVNLPENATTAKFESVTLPQTFDLDALDVSDVIYLEGSPDNHLRSHNEITLADQIPLGRDPYIAISFDEDVVVDISPPDQGPCVRPMEEDIISLPVDTDVAFQDIGPINDKTTDSFQDPGLINQTQVPSNDQIGVISDILDLRDPGPSSQTEVIFSRLANENSPPEVEIMRNDPRDFGPETFPSVWPDFQNDVTEPKRSSNQVLNEEEILPPTLEDNSPSGAKSIRVRQLSESPALHEAPEIYEPSVSFGRMSPALAIRSTPPLQQQQPRKRKKRNFFDETTVLSNKVMKKRLEDSRDLLRKGRDFRRLPLSALGKWKWNNSLRKEHIFYRPSITGSCTALCHLFEKDCIFTKPHLILDQEAVTEPRMANFPACETEAILETENASSPPPEGVPEPTVAQPPDQGQEISMEMERLRTNEDCNGNSLLREFLPSPASVMPSPGRCMSSLFRRDDFPTMSGGCLESETASLASKTTGTGLLRTLDSSAPSVTSDSDLGTPRTSVEDRCVVGNTGLSDIPEFMNTADAEDLYFLEADDTPPGSQAIQGIDSMSVRTRAVVRYLKRHSPVMTQAEDSCGDLSLNQILQGKTRKLCARMFFETLVLKSYGLVDVHQEQPYGDIVLKLTPVLSKAQL